MRVFDDGTDGYEDENDELMVMVRLFVCTVNCTVC